MNIFRKIPLAFFCGALMVAGCFDSVKPKKSPHPSDTQNSAKRFELLPEDAILISVNGRALTKRTFVSWVDLRQKILSMSAPKEHDISPAQLSFVQEQMLESVTNDFAHEVVLHEYAREHGIMATSNEILQCRIGFQRSLPAKSRSWKAVRTKFSAAQRKTINDRVASEAVSLAVHNQYQKEHPVDVDNAEAKKLYDNYLGYNKTCAASNTLIWAQASNVWQRIVKGENFYELAEKFSEDEYKTSDAEWGVFHTGDFSDEPAIWKLAKNFKKGWISPPVEGDNGLMIMKIESLEDGDANVESSDYVPSPNATFTISRIFFRLPLFAEEIDFEHFTNEVKRAKAISSYKKFVSELVRKAKIEYPCGLEIFSQKKKRLPRK